MCGAMKVFDKGINSIFKVHYKAQLIFGRILGTK